MRIARVLGWATVWGLLAAGMGCASDPGAAARVAGPFTERHAQLFDDSVDMVENPQELGGRWQEDWEKELDERFTDSDVIAKGRLVTVRTDEDLEKRKTFHLVVSVEETLQGKHDGKELSVRVAQGELGYTNVERYGDQILGKPFIVFARRALDADGKVIVHFHLSTPSAYLQQRIDRWLAKSKPSTIRVIERTN